MAATRRLVEEEGRSKVTDSSKSEIRAARWELGRLRLGVLGAASEAAGQLRRLRGSVLYGKLPGFWCGSAVTKYIPIDFGVMLGFVTLFIVHHFYIICLTASNI